MSEVEYSPPQSSQELPGGFSFTGEFTQDNMFSGVFMGPKGEFTGSVEKIFDKSGALTGYHVSDYSGDLGEVDLPLVGVVEPQLAAIPAAEAGEPVVFPAEVLAEGAEAALEAAALVGEATPVAEVPEPEVVEPAVEHVTTEPALATPIIETPAAREFDDRLAQVNSIEEVVRLLNDRLNQSQETLDGRQRRLVDLETERQGLWLELTATEPYAQRDLPAEDKTDSFSVRERELIKEAKSRLPVIRQRLVEIDGDEKNPGELKQARDQLTKDEQELSMRMLAISNIRREAELWKSLSEHPEMFQRYLELRQTAAKYKGILEHPETSALAPSVVQMMLREVENNLLSLHKNIPRRLLELEGLTTEWRLTPASTEDPSLHAFEERYIYERAARRMRDLLKAAPVASMPPKAVESEPELIEVAEPDEAPVELEALEDEPPTPEGPGQDELTGEVMATEMPSAPGLDTDEGVPASQAVFDAPPLPEVAPSGDGLAGPEAGPAEPEAVMPDEALGVAIEAFGESVNNPDGRKSSREQKQTVLAAAEGVLATAARLGRAGPEATQRAQRALAPLAQAAPQWFALAGRRILARGVTNEHGKLLSDRELKARRDQGLLEALLELLLTLGDKTIDAVVAEVKNKTEGK